MIPMFTGLIQTTARLASVTPRVSGAATLRLRLDAPLSGGPLMAGESIAVNGICLTLTDASDPLALVFDVLLETLDRSSLSAKAPGDRLNIERALRVGDPLGGHLVSGHVDGTAHLVSATPAGPDMALTLRVRPDHAADILPYLFPKGSVALDGISLTLTAVDSAAATFQVHVIPHTFAETALSELAPGDLLNVEADLIAKAARNAAASASGAASPAPPPITWERLRDAGFC
jgi:riboflavin synthase